MGLCHLWGLSRLERPFARDQAINRDGMMNVNLRALFVCYAAALKPMQGAGRGRIVAVAEHAYAWSSRRPTSRAYAGVEGGASGAG